ncbi:MAG: beta strand repeat-containing protein, partial [Novosphingobium sp.]
TFIEDQFTTPTDIFNGGIGFDTIELRAAPVPIQTNLGALTPHSLNGTGQMSSIERIVFASQVGQVVQATLGFSNWQAAGITQIVGGAGREILTVSTGNVAGTYTMPTLPLSGWDAVPVNAWEHTGDLVVLSAGAATTGVTLNALAGASFFQVLIGGSGNDFLNGSDNADSINAAIGADTVNAAGGNDTIAIVNSANPNGFGGWNVPTSFTGAGGTWDGGSGTDVISIGGAVNLQATLVSIEGVQLQAAFFPSIANTARQEAAVLTLDSAHIAMLPGNAFFTGTGTVVFNLSNGVGLNGASYVITPGSTVNFEINAGIGDGLFFSGNSGNDTIFLCEGVQTANGGNGDDIIQFGIGDQTGIGGAGADRFRIGPGIGGVLDFTVGTDKIDMSDTGITTMSRFNDLSFVDALAGATLSGSTQGQNFQMVLHGVSRASVGAGDILLGTGGYINIEFGSGFNDLLFGFELNDELHGGGGNDRLYAGGGVDKLYGDDGNDVLILDGAAAIGGTFDGGTGTDTLLLRPGSTAISGGPNTQFFALPTAPGTGLISIEKLQFDSSAGYGLTLIANSTPGFNEVIGGAGLDVLVLVAIGAGSFTMPNFTLTNWNGGILPSQDALVFTVANGQTAGATLNARSGVSQILLGALGDDTLNGSDMADILNGNAGADTLTGNGGADQLNGEAGNDRLVIGATSAGSSINGGTETDTLAVTGSVGGLASLVSIEAVELSGGANLTLSGSQFSNGLAATTVLSGTGSITINMETGFNVITSQFSNAPGANVSLIINGTSGTDVVKVALSTVIEAHGGDGADQLRGGNLADAIFGDGGNDKIMGLSGADQLTGGSGADQFRYLFTSDTGLAAAADSILDFAIGTDKLDFRALDANAGVAGRQLLSFVGTGAFTATGVGEVRYETSGANLLVSIDYNGDGVTDGQIVLVGDGGQTLAGTDFLF